MKCQGWCKGARWKKNWKRSRRQLNLDPRGRWRIVNGTLRCNWFNYNLLFRYMEQSSKKVKLNEGDKRGSWVGAHDTFHSYLVCSWFSDSQFDPNKNSTSGGPRSNQKRWSLSGSNYSLPWYGLCQVWTHFWLNTGFITIYRKLVDCHRHSKYILLFYISHFINEGRVGN